MPDLVFVSVLDGTNPVRVRFANSFKFTSLRLVRYSINGIPVTSGIPNSNFYNLSIQGAGTDSTITFRNDNYAGKPIPLYDAFTHADLSEPIELCRVPSPVTIQDVTFKLTDPSGNDATFTSFALWLAYD